MLALIAAGLIAGWLTGLVMRGSGYGPLADIALGLVGAFVGGWLFGALAPEMAEPSGFVGLVVVATIGAIFLVALSRLIGGRPIHA